MLLFELLNVEKKWLHKAELLEAHCQTVYTSRIYVLYCFDSTQKVNPTACKSTVHGQKQKLLYHRSGPPIFGLRPT